MHSADVQHVEDARTAPRIRSHSTWNMLVQHVKITQTAPAAHGQEVYLTSHVVVYSIHRAVCKGHDIYVFLSRIRA